MEKAEGRPSEGAMQAVVVSGDGSTVCEGSVVTGTEMGGEWGPGMEAE